MLAVEKIRNHELAAQEAVKFVASAGSESGPAAGPQVSDSDALRGAGQRMKK